MKSRLDSQEDTPQTVTARVRERIRAAILSGELPAGSRLDQAQLAADLHVSLVPVREALKTMDSEGFIKIIPRRGAFVADISAKDVEDLYAARQLLEGQTAAQAVTSLTDSHLATLHALMQQMISELDRHDYPAFMISNRQFHFTIYTACDNPYLTNMITTLWDMAERYRFQYVLRHERGQVIQSEHQVILDACRARNAAHLRDAITHHLQRTLDEIKTDWQQETPL